MPGKGGTGSAAGQVTRPCERPARHQVRAARAGTAADRAPASARANVRVQHRLHLSQGSGDAFAVHPAVYRRRHHQPPTWTTPRRAETNSAPAPAPHLQTRSSRSRELDPPQSAQIRRASHTMPSAARTSRRELTSFQPRPSQEPHEPGRVAAVMTSIEAAGQRGTHHRPRSHRRVFPVASPIFGACRYTTAGYMLSPAKRGDHPCERAYWKPLPYPRTSGAPTRFSTPWPPATSGTCSAWCRR